MGTSVNSALLKYLTCLKRFDPYLLTIRRFFEVPLYYSRSESIPEVYIMKRDMKLIDKILLCMEKSAPGDDLKELYDGIDKKEG
jgi:hypothetical protein